MKRINFFIALFLITIIFAHNDKTAFMPWEIKNSINSLDSAPLLSINKKSNIIISFPTPEGNFKKFYMYESPVMPEALSDKFPSIKTYTGIGIESQSERVSLTFSNTQIKAMILGKTNNIFISSSDSNNLFRVSYLENDFDTSIDNIQCGHTELYDQLISERAEGFEECVGEDEPCYTMGDVLVTYRTAFIMTESVTNAVADGTVEGGMAWVASMVNQLNLLWLRELSYKLELVANNDVLIFTDTNPAPGGEFGFTYTWENCTQADGDPKYCELPNVKPYLDSVIGVGGDTTPVSSRFWEYGLLLKTTYNGGVAYAPGSTSANNPTYAVINHEMGHNLGSSHNISIEGGFTSSLGGTIMGSRTRTISGNFGDQYSSHTIEIASRNYNTFSENSYVKGYNTVQTNNVIPEINVPESGFYIPKDTPFVLTGSTTPYNTNYTFSWEQNDASSTSFCMDLTGYSGECSGLSPWPSSEGPLFATVDLHEDGYTRYFPSMNSLLNNEYNTTFNDYGTNLTVERLPFGSRDINMRLQVRTNDVQSSAINFKNLQFSVDGNSGPFRVLSQDSQTTWISESTQTIIWDVANTDQSPVNCSNVDIYLSTDAGKNFDTLLAENVLNDGSEDIMLPMLANIDSCRIMVKASDNIFFDINNGNISIENSQLPNISISTNSIDLQSLASNSFNTGFTLTNNGEDGSVLIYDIDIVDNIFLSEDFENLTLDNTVSSVEYNLPNDWERLSSGRGWIIGTEETSAWAEWLLVQVGDMYFDIPDWSGGNYAFTDDEQYNICPSCTQYADCFDVNGCTDGSMDFLITPSIMIPSQSLAKLSFDYWFQYTIGNQHNNTLQIFYNDEWIDIESLNQSQNQFTHNTYNLDDYSGNEIKIRFHSESNESGDGLGGGWAVDNVVLESSPKWIETSNMSGSLVSGQSISIPLSINTVELDIGETYTTNIYINDLVNNLSDEINLSLEVNDCSQEFDQCGVCGGDGTSCELMGDFSGDGIVNIVDIVTLVNLVFSSEYNLEADFNSDNVVNVVDVIILVNIVLDQ